MKVFVIADNILARVGLAALLTTLDDVEIVGQASLSETLADEIGLYRPEITVADLSMVDRGGLSRINQWVDVPLLALIPSGAEAQSILSALTGGGGGGVLLRDSDPEALFAALKAVYQGLVVIDSALAASLLTSPQSDDEDPLEELTPREREVLQLLAEGLPNKSIAQKLEISANTVKFHINAILSKLDAQSRTEAVVKATRAGLIIL